MAPALLIDEAPDATATLLLAHGAGAAMDSPAMQATAEALAGAGFRVVRFEFAYMAGRRDGSRRPPPRAEMLTEEYKAAVTALAAKTPLLIGGRSLGGRVASLVADDLFDTGAVQGLLCLSYPFHPPGKPEQLRTQHLAALKTPTLICQGTRDPFGSREEVEGYALSPSIRLFWLEDGDHSLTPRKRLTGLTAADHLKALAGHTRDWAESILPRPDRP